MNKHEIFENLVRTVRSNVVEKLKTFSQKGLAGDLDVPYSYITWLGSSQPKSWFTVPNFYIYFLASKLSIAVPEILLDERAKEFTKRNVNIDIAGKITFNKTHHSGSRKKKKDSVVPKSRIPKHKSMGGMKKTGKGPAEKKPGLPTASFDMKPEGEKVPDLASKSTDGPDDKPGAKENVKTEITTAGPERTVPAQNYLGHDYDFNQLCSGLIKDLGELMDKILSIQKANVELNFLADNEKGFLFDIVIHEIQKTLGRSEKLPK